MKEVTIIIAEHNEEKQLGDTLRSLYDTSDQSRYNVVVVSDGSELEPEIVGDVNHIRVPRRQGVGASFDTGALYADTPYMIIMGSDIRFTDNGYLDKMLDHLKDNQKSFICTANVGINPDQMDISKSKRKR